MMREKTVYRVFDSKGTVTVETTKSRARKFKETGYPIEVWKLSAPGGSTIHQAKQKLLMLDGGKGPAHLSSGQGERLGRIEDVEC